MELDTLVEGSENNDNTRMTKQAFLFRSAVRLYAGFFTKMHSSMELTGRRGIRMLGFREKVYKLVVNGGYSDSTKARVTEVMDKWLGLAKEVHAISIICNDQAKQDDEEVAKFTNHVVNYLHLWRPYVGYKNPLFHKAHSLFCGLLATMKIYGMTGRLNAQGFENKHFEIARLKEILGRIAQRWLRVQKMAERNQSMFVEGLTDSLNFLEELTENGMYSIVIHFVFLLGLSLFS